MGSAAQNRDYVFKININMRCIEMTALTNDIIHTAKININMRCIEMLMAEELLSALAGLTLT